MKFGIFFEHQLPRPWKLGDEQALFTNSLEWVEIADRVGVDYAWAQEHHFLEEYSHSTAPEVFLGACSQRTKRIRLGHGITLMPPAYNHPARVAERIATLDLVSQGRVEWGTGESSSRLELEGFQASYIEKRAMWAEAVREAALMMCSTPYRGHTGRYFSMPPRNIVPKPVQQPHPPLWVACTSRDTMKLAARLGLGALTFAFMDAGESKHWVNEYYETFKRECTPIGRTVNPNIAMLSGYCCHRDGSVARRRGLDGQQFFAWALAHYYQFGVHTPGRTDLWQKFKDIPSFPMAGNSGVGSPDEVRTSFRALEDTGLDQIILLQQAAGYEHDHICESLELLGSEIIDEFKEREEIRAKRKEVELAPYIEKALAKIPPLDEDFEVPAVETYPVQWAKKGMDYDQLGGKRAGDADVLWRLNVGGKVKVTREPRK